MEEELEDVLEEMEEDVESSLPTITESVIVTAKPTGVMPDEHNKICCTKCGRMLEATQNFFALRDKTRYPICKEDLTAFVDNKDRKTFEWILEIFDVPYIDEQWKKIYNETMEKKNKVGRADVLGKYLRLMKMNQYKDYRYKDTDQLEFKFNKEREQIAARKALNNPEVQKQMVELQRQLDSGEITQAQYDTLNPLQYLEEDHEFLEFSTSIGVDEEEIRRNLSDEEYAYLKSKWGGSFKPSQWVTMEDLYVRYENEYELDVDREETLKQICKVTLRMNEALDIGDLKGYRDLASTCNTLRTSACFTTAQKKENKTEVMSSIGELVRFCEVEGGIIEQIPCPDEYPQDDIDYAIKNMKSYYYDLVTNELGLGNMIEAYIKRLEESAKEGEIDFDANLITSEEEMEAYRDDLEALEFTESIEQEIAEILGESDGQEV